MGPRTLDVRQPHDPLDTPTAPNMRWPPRRAGTRRPAVRARGPRRARRPARRGRDDGLVLDQKIVEFALLDALDERRDLSLRVDERRPFRIPWVTDGELPASQPGDLDAGPLRVAHTAL